MCYLSRWTASRDAGVLPERLVLWRVDHGYPHAAGGEFDRRAQAVRAGADDKYLGAGERRGGREATA